MKKSNLGGALLFVVGALIVIFLVSNQAIKNGKKNKEKHEEIAPEVNEAKRVADSLKDAGEDLTKWKIVDGKAIKLEE